MSTNQSNYQNDDSIVPQEQHHHHHHQHHVDSNSAGLGSSNDAGYLEDGQAGQRQGSTVPLGEPMKNHGVIAQLMYVMNIISVYHAN
jgi:hypothetical protein